MPPPESTRTSAIARGISAALAALALAPAAGAQPAGQAEDRTRAFEALRRRMDLDLDGRVGRDEWLRGRAAFQRLDRDRDGFLTAADFGGAPRAPAGEGESSGPAPSSAEAEFFEARIRPVLASSCYGCHSDAAPKLRAGLRVDSRAGLLAGGASGPAIVPGDPDASALIHAVRYGDPDLAMPPKKALDAEAVRDLEQWIAMGAPWPETPVAGVGGALASPPIDLAKAREFWSFRPLAPEAPSFESDWASSEIDRFLHAAMTELGVTPVGDADARTWLRRVTFDLTGLPPAPEEIDAFVADPSPAARKRVVDRLLASRAFGERFGRHWLDVARYAESSGKETNIVYPHAWRYRDWVIDAFDADMPFDRMIEAQIAGDLLPAADVDERARNLIATGYLALGSKGHNSRDARQFSLDLADEQIDAVTRGMLGLTVSCARCHDHKFDPIPTADYYSLAGIFLSTQTLYGTHRGPGNNHPAALIELPPGAGVPNGPRMEPGLRALVVRIRDGFARNLEAGPSRDPAVIARQRLARQQLAVFDALLERFDPSGAAGSANRLAMGVGEGKPRDVAVLDRGELDRPGAIAPRGVPRVLADDSMGPIESGSGRLELARWIASDTNPLTARVWVNRVWLHLFGAGIVRTPDHFGSGGQPPDHPELLDWLASEFIADGWSTKALVRRIVLSRAYGLDSARHAENEALDPDVATLWRMPARRLEGEAVRDAMLSVAGVLEEPPVGSRSGLLEGALQREELVDLVTVEQPVRSVYLPSLRGNVVDALDVFDAPDASFVTGDREETSVATQALFLMNDEGVIRLADAFAARLLALDGGDAARIERAFELAFARPPSKAEARAVREFIAEFERLAAEPEGAARDAGKGRGESSGRARSRERSRARDRAAAGLEPPLKAPASARFAAWSAFAQTLFHSAEFRTIG